MNVCVNLNICFYSLNPFLLHWWKWWLPPVSEIHMIRNSDHVWKGGSCGSRNWVDDGQMTRNCMACTDILLVFVFCFWPWLKFSSLYSWIFCIMTLWREYIILTALSRSQQSFLTEDGSADVIDDIQNWSGTNIDSKT